MATRTVKIPLTLTSEQSLLLLDTLKTASQAYNLLASLAVQNQVISKQKLHEQYYGLLREKYPALPSAYQQALRDTLVGNLKSIHATHPSKKWSITPSKKATSSLRLDQRTFTLRGEQLTLSTTGARIKTIINVPAWFTNKYPALSVSKSASLSYNKQSKKFFINLIYQGEIVPSLSERSETIGLDRGVYNLVTTSTGEHYGSKHMRAKRREHLYLRKKLQQKGTRSAKRLLVKRSGKEKRFMLNNNHVIVNKLIQTNPTSSTFVLETLTGIKNHKRGKKINTFLNQWSYYQLETILTYKAQDRGIRVKHIDPRYTSQACNQCGIINKNNRFKNKYSCACGWVTHADVNAAMNIRDLAGGRKISQSLKIEQGLVNDPHESTF